MEVVISYKDGAPYIVRRDDGRYWFARTESTLRNPTAQGAGEEISRGFGGEPTKCAVHFGVIKQDWPYRLFDETEDEFDSRLGK